jgi:hypothetical protein
MEHHVYFWLKEERRGEEDRKKFQQGLKDLCLSPYPASAHWGSPAATAERPVTDHSFDYGLSLSFNSMEDHDHYQEKDEVHAQFVATFGQWWERVLVMDLA